jgi:hypothetical protein
MLATVNWSVVLLNMFEDPRFREFDLYRICGEVDGIKTGIVLATMNPGFSSYALNKGALERLRCAKLGNKVEEAYVVAAQVKGKERVYRGFLPIEEVCHKIEVFGLEPRLGKFGEFFVLPPGMFPADDNTPW